jgi:hypothetical protein
MFTGLTRTKGVLLALRPPRACWVDLIELRFGQIWVGQGGWQYQALFLSCVFDSSVSGLESRQDQLR